MPYKSKAQARAMHAKAERGEISQKTVKEFDKATDFGKLPEKVKAKEGADGSHEGRAQRGVHESHKRIWTGHPNEMKDGDGGSK